MYFYCQPDCQSQLFSSKFETICSIKENELETINWLLFVLEFFKDMLTGNALVPTVPFISLN